MDHSELTLFPFPTYHAGAATDGALYSVHPYCGRRCKFECRSATGDDVAVCPYGVHYVHVGDVLVYGVCLAGSPPTNEPQRKARQRATRTLENGSFSRGIEALRRAQAARKQTADSAVERAIVEAYDAGELSRRVVAELSVEIQRAVGQFHDYRALAGRALRNIEVFLRKTFPPHEDVLQAEAYELVSARWAITLMLEKLDVALFLLEPERIRLFEDAPTRLHGLVSKYVHIYRREAQEKGVRLNVVGDSYSEISGNSAAMSVIPHAYIDNAVKYAPPSSSVTVQLVETDDEIVVSVESLGPRIERREQRKIFEPFFRGSKAREAEPTAMGFGLAAARVVGEECGIRLNVKQSESMSDKPGYYPTTFTACFRIARKRSRES